MGRCSETQLSGKGLTLVNLADNEPTNKQKEVLLFAGKSLSTLVIQQRSLGYERVYLPLCKVSHTPFHIQGDNELLHKLYKLDRLQHICTQNAKYRVIHLIQEHIIIIEGLMLSFDDITIYSIDKVHVYTVQKELISTIHYRITHYCYYHTFTCTLMQAS